MNLNQDKGFSLVQVMIAAGLMSMLSLFMLKMQENQRMSQNKIEMDGEISSFMNKLNGFFHRGDYCEKNIVGKNVQDGVGEPIELEKFIAPNGKVIFEKGGLYGNRTFELASITKDNFFYDSEDRHSGNLTLMVKLKKHKKSFGAKIIAKKIDLMVYLNDNGKITACNSNSFTGGTPSMGITTEDIHKVVTGTPAVPSTNSQTKQASQPAKTTVPAITTVPAQKSASATQTAQQKAEIIQKTIDNNPALQELQKSIKAMQESNKAMQKMLEEDGL